MDRTHFYGQPEECYFTSGEPPYTVRLDANMRRETAEFEDFDSCFLWAMHRLMLRYSDPEEIDNMKVLIVDDVGFAYECKNLDKLITNVWKSMSDIPFSFDDKLEHEWFVFDAGTDKSEIMEFFDHWYSGGARGLEEKCN